MTAPAGIASQNFDGVTQYGRVGMSGAIGNPGYDGSVVRVSNTTSRRPFTWVSGRTLPLPMGAPSVPWHVPHCVSSQRGSVSRLGISFLEHVTARGVEPVEPGGPGRRRRIGRREVARLAGDRRRYLTGRGLPCLARVRRTAEADVVPELPPLVGEPDVRIRARRACAGRRVPGRIPWQPSQPRSSPEVQSGARANAGACWPDEWQYTPLHRCDAGVVRGARRVPRAQRVRASARRRAAPPGAPCPCASSRRADGSCRSRTGRRGHPSARTPRGCGDRRTSGRSALGTLRGRGARRSGRHAVADAARAGRIHLAVDVEPAREIDRAVRLHRVRVADAAPVSTGCGAGGGAPWQAPQEVWPVETTVHSGVFAPVRSFAP